MQAREDRKSRSMTLTSIVPLVSGCQVRGAESRSSAPVSATQASRSRSGPIHGPRLPQDRGPLPNRSSHSQMISNTKDKRDYTILCLQCFAESCHLVSALVMGSQVADAYVVGLTLLRQKP
jgi:hypothetical protein